MIPDISRFWADIGAVNRRISARFGYQFSLNQRTARLMLRTG